MGYRVKDRVGVGDSDRRYPRDGGDGLMNVGVATTGGNTPAVTCDTGDGEDAAMASVVGSCSLCPHLAPA